MIRSIRRLINRFRGVPLVLCCLAQGCLGTGQVEPETCDSAWADCEAQCDGGLSCRAECSGSLGACNKAKATPDPCLDSVEACLSVCPENSAPSYTQNSSCQASCGGSYVACQEHPIASVCYMHSDNVSYDCDGQPDPKALAFSRTCAYLGLSNNPVAPQHWFCK